MEIKSIALLTNPKSGKGNAVEKTQIALERFAELGIEVELLKGNSCEDSIRLSREAIASGKYDALVVCGGDGLIGDALQAQANTGFPLGIIPAGTGNDHARYYNLPLDPREAVDVIAQGNELVTDLGRVRVEAGEKWFGTIACCGFDSLVNERTNTISWPKGKARYVVATVIEILSLRGHKAQLTIGDEVLNRSLMMISIGNTSMYGGGRAICPDAVSTDGKFHITVTSVKNRLRSILLVNKITKGKFAGIPEVEVLVTDRLHLDFEGAALYADGDWVTNDPAEIECVPNAGKYLVPVK